MSPSSPIVVLDSGLGGLTVVRALQAALPHEDVLYFGDTARVPWGAKSPANVCAFVRQIIAFLQPHDPKHVLLACNTATALALPQVRGEFPGLSISGVIEPGAADTRARLSCGGQSRRGVRALRRIARRLRERAGFEIGLFDDGLRREGHHKIGWPPGIVDHQPRISGIGEIETQIDRIDMQIEQIVWADDLDLADHD